MKLFFLFFFFLIATVRAIPMYVNARTGELTPAFSVDGTMYDPPAVFGKWPLPDGKCSNTLDAQLIASIGIYQVNEYVYNKMNFGSWAQASSFTFEDLQRAVLWLRSMGLWDIPGDCGHIHHIFNNQIQHALLEQISFQKRPTLTAHYQGIVVDILCWTNESEDKRCTGEKLIKLQHGAIQSNKRS